VKEVMLENIDQVLRRGEKLEDLMQVTEDMVVQANQFQKQSTSLKRAMWWKNLKMWFIIIGIVIGVILIIVIVVVSKAKKNN